MRCCFLGTDTIALAALRRIHALQRDTVTTLNVICGLDHREGYSRQRRGPVREYAESAGLHYTQVDERIGFTLPEGWAPFEADVGIVVSFGHRLPDSFIQSFPYGVINMHPSLLPKYRGAAPIPWAIIHGEEYSGVSVVRLQPALKIDMGDVLYQQTVPIGENQTYVDVHKLLSETGAEALEYVLRKLPDGMDTIQLDESVESKARKIRESDCYIDWKNMSAEEVFNRWRGVLGLRRVFTNLNGKRINICSLSRIEQNSSYNLDPGSVWFDKENRLLKIVCKNGSIVACTELNISGKPKTVNPVEFNNGYLRRSENGIVKFM